MADSPGVVEWAQPQSQPVRRNSRVDFFPSFFAVLLEVTSEDKWHQPPSQPIPNNYAKRSDSYRSSLISSGMMPYNTVVIPDSVTADRFMFAVTQPYPYPRSQHPSLMPVHEWPSVFSPGSLPVFQAPVAVVQVKIQVQSQILSH
jgi:hypothetical protein